jgi:hypothetical protein
MNLTQISGWRGCIRKNGEESYSPSEIEFFLSKMRIAYLREQELNPNKETINETFEWIIKTIKNKTKIIPL